MTEENFTPTTETVRSRYLYAMLPDEVTIDIAERMEKQAYAEFDRWLEAERERIREELKAEAAEENWEYGWRSFFPGGEEYEWLNLPSREEAEADIRSLQEAEESEDKDIRLTYSLWRRRTTTPGSWERVGDSTDG